MSALIWKLLRQHISIGQLAGFFLANLFGMMIVLLSVQFYKDIIPVFTEGDIGYRMTGIEVRQVHIEGIWSLETKFQNLHTREVRIRQELFSLLINITKVFSDNW